MSNSVPRRISYPSTSPFGEMHLWRHSIDEERPNRANGPVPSLALAAARLLQRQLLETSVVITAMDDAGLDEPKGPGLIPATVGLGRQLYHAFYRPGEAAAWYATKREFDGTAYSDEQGLSGVGVLRCTEQRTGLARTVTGWLRPDKLGPEVTNIEAFSTSPELNVALLDAGIRYYLAIRPDGPIAIHTPLLDTVNWIGHINLGFRVTGYNLREDQVAGISLVEELMAATSAREVQERISEQYPWVIEAEIS